MLNFMALTSTGTASEALKTALASGASEMTTMLGDVVGYAVPVMIGVAVITLGIKAFKRFSK